MKNAKGQNETRLEIVSAGTAERLAGVSRVSLRTWARQGKIRYWLTRNGEREWMWFALEDLGRLILERAPRQGPSDNGAQVPIAARSEGGG